MCSQELRRRLQAVDPNLNIVPAGARHSSTPAGTEWDHATGVICKNCGKEVFRSRDDLCLPCWEKSNEIEVRDHTGITNWMPSTILEQITHQARKKPD